MNLLIVTGSRKYENFGKLNRSLTRLHATKSIDIMFSGECPEGADYYCEYWAKRTGVQNVKLPAAWASERGRGSGFYRNQLMVDIACSYAATVEKPRLLYRAFVLPCDNKACPKYGQPDHFTHGTEDCLKRLKNAGIQGIEVDA